MPLLMQIDTHVRLFELSTYLCVASAKLLVNKSHILQGVKSSYEKLTTAYPRRLASQGSHLLKEVVFEA